MTNKASVHTGLSHNNIIPTWFIIYCYERVVVNGMC